ALCASLSRPVRAGSLRSLLPLTLLVAALFCSTAAYPMRGGEPEWHVLGTLVREEVAAPETLIFYPGDKPQWYADILYLGVGHYAMSSFPHPLVSLTRPARAELMASIPGDTAWLISGPLDRPAEQVLPGCTVLEQHTLPNLAI